MNPTDECLNPLREHVVARGKLDAFISQDEESQLFQKARDMHVDEETAEAVLNDVCRDRGWSRETDLIADIRDQLEEALSDDGKIDRLEFELTVNYAVSMNMPRKRALERVVRFVVDREMPVKTALFETDWFEPLRKQYSGEPAG